MYEPKLNIKKWLLVGTLSCVCQVPAVLADTVVPYGNGTWIYDGQYDSSGNKTSVKAGLFLNQITAYNKTAPGHELTQVFPYGGDIEMYCRGSGETESNTPCTPNSLLLVYYPPATISKSKDNWDYWNSLGDSGFSTQQAYLNIPGVKQVIVDIDGRVDNGKNSVYDYLDHLNDLGEADAKHFADVVAKGICANNTIDGVQFDIEPFSFTGEGGTVQGPGQKYFYTEIAKDFAGYYGNSGDPSGINPDATSDPLHCVSSAHPQGRIFSVFTFSKQVTSDVYDTFTHHGNGYIVDSLYDLGNKPGGQLNTPDEFKQLVAQEIDAIKKKEIPYQLAIPAAASAHEFEMGPVQGVGAGNQIQYVHAALEAIQNQNVKSDPNFKGINLWGWNQAMWWSGKQFTPAYPQQNVLEYLKNNL